MIKQYSVVRLKSSLAAIPVVLGSTGTVLIVHDSRPEAYEVEFINEAGQSLGTYTVAAEYLEEIEYVGEMKPLTGDRRLWSATLVNGLGLVFSPFASIGLQAVNYRRAGLDREVRVCWAWFGVLFVAGLVWSQIPMHLSRDDRLVAGVLYTFATWVVWFIAYGRRHRTKVGQLPGASVEYRSPLTAIGLAIAVWLGVAVVQVVFVLGIDFVRR